MLGEEAEGDGGAVVEEVGGGDGGEVLGGEEGGDGVGGVAVVVVSMSWIVVCLLVFHM